jgi:hypothetical protein
MTRTTLCNLAIAVVLATTASVASAHTDEQAYLAIAMLLVLAVVGGALFAWVAGLAGASKAVIIAAAAIGAVVGFTTPHWMGKVGEFFEDVADAIVDLGSALVSGVASVSDDDDSNGDSDEGVSEPDQFDSPRKLAARNKRKTGAKDPEPTPLSECNRAARDRCNKPVRDVTTGKLIQYGDGDCIDRGHLECALQDLKRGPPRPGECEKRVRGYCKSKSYGDNDTKDPALFDQCVQEWMKQCQVKMGQDVFLASLGSRP